MLGGRARGGVSLDGIRRPDDGLLPLFVDGVRSAERDQAGPSRSRSVAAWPYSSRDRGGEVGLSSDLQDLSPFRGDDKLFSRRIDDPHSRKEQGRRRIADEPPATRMEDPYRSSNNSRS